MRKSLSLAVLVACAAVALPAAEMANLQNGFSIRHEHHDTLGDTTRLYLGSSPDSGYVEVATSDIESFVAAPREIGQQEAPAGLNPNELGRIVASASQRSRIDADFIASLIKAESANNPRAISRKGAKGLMQLMPPTASSLGVTDSFDPEQNVDGGVRYLQELLVRYHGDAAQALAAYNAGPARVDQYHGVPPYRETHAYVTRIINDYNRKKLADQKAQRSKAHGRAAAVTAASNSPSPGN